MHVSRSAFGAVPQPVVCPALPAFQHFRVSAFDLVISAFQPFSFCFGAFPVSAFEFVLSVFQHFSMSAFGLVMSAF
jgi:hypothetical protein